MTQLFDSIGLARPAGLQAGYDDGLYANWAEVVARFGSAAVLAITVNPADDEGNCLDVENGDARPADVPGWVVRARARGVFPVWVYCNRSTWLEVAQPLTHMPDRWWIADYTGHPHFPTLGGWVADACLYAGGPTAAYDVSCVRLGAFDLPPSAYRPPGPQPKEECQMVLANDGTTQFIVTVKADGTLLANPIRPLSGDPSHPELGQISAAIPNLGTVPAFLSAIPRGAAV